MIIIMIMILITIIITIIIIITITIIIIRLYDSCRSMLFEEISLPSRDYIITALKKTLKYNNMYDGVHVRLTLSRGSKSTSSMNPKFNVFGSCLIIVPEWKPVGWC